MSAAASIADAAGVIRGRDLVASGSDAAGGEWCLEAVTGRVAELCGEAQGAVLTAASDLILRAQQQGCLVAWVHGTASTVNPPDLADSGIDLESLPFIVAPDAITALRSTDMLIRSEAFAFVVAELPHSKRVPLSIQSRLAGLTKTHRTGLVFITRDTDRSEFPLVSLRAVTSKTRHAPGVYSWNVHAVKDKRSAPGWHYEEFHCGTDGLS